MDINVWPVDEGVDTICLSLLALLQNATQEEQ